LSITVIDVGEKLVTRPESVVAFELAGTRSAAAATATRVLSPLVVIFVLPSGGASTPPQKLNQSNISH
jgi:hypothetical protein